MSDDPTWLDECRRFAWKYVLGDDSHPDSRESQRVIVRRILAFAAHQPREITEAEVEEVLRSWYGPAYATCSADNAWSIRRTEMRAALETGDKARIAELTDEGKKL
jgi:hypothetical protein